MARADALTSCQRILEAASALLGDRRITMSEVAAAAGLGRDAIPAFCQSPAIDEALDVRQARQSQAMASGASSVSLQVATMPFLAPG
jgi:hypothetical protein